MQAEWWQWIIFYAAAGGLPVWIFLQLWIAVLKNKGYD